MRNVKIKLINWSWRYVRVSIFVHFYWQFSLKCPWQSNSVFNLLISSKIHCNSSSSCEVKSKQEICGFDRLSFVDNSVPWIKTLKWKEKSKKNLLNRYSPLAPMTLWTKPLIPNIVAVSNTLKNYIIGLSPTSPWPLHTMLQTKFYYLRCLKILCS